MNMLTPVNGLPPEILSRVLEYRRRDRSLVAATHVCRYWRSALVSSPSLWTRIRAQSDRDLDRTLTYLERSKSAPIDIDIYLELGLPRSLEMYKSLAQHIARVRSFSLSGFPEGVHAVSLLFHNPAPSLQHLNLKGRIQDSPARLPDDFLGRHAPSLRSAHFDDILPTLESLFPLPNLTEFTLFLRGSADPLCMSGLFRFLSNSSRLRKISIRVSNEMLQDITPDQVTSLESLEELELCCSQPGGRVPPHLRLPRLKSLSVSLPFQVNEVEKLSDFLPSGSHLLEGVTGMTYYTNSFLQRVEFYGEGIIVELCMFHAEPYRVPLDWLSNTLCTPFGHIEELTVECRFNAPHFPINAFENLDTLQVLESDEIFMGELFHSLSPRSGIPCPSLRQIWYLPRGSLDSVTDLVKARLQAGHRLGLVWLPSSREDDEDHVSELRKFVGEVRIGSGGRKLETPVDH
jgi:hypothetical protein